MKKVNAAGFTLIEVLITIVILSLVSMAGMKAFYFMTRTKVSTAEKSFATQKAMQMMEELRGLLVDPKSTVGILDDYDDRGARKFILTTRSDVTSPLDPLSGNEGFKYTRTISVIPVPNEPSVRRVYVRVYRARTNEALAETMSLLRTVNKEYPATQVMDIFVLVIENVPGWWTNLTTMRPMFDNIVQDLKTRNPGLEWRVHYITQLAYGRDPFYTPYINSAANVASKAMPSVYFYPGKVDTSYYFDPSRFTGRINVDGTVKNAASYSIADQFNNAVRYPDEERLYNQDCFNADIAGVPRPEITYRMLLERMISTPDDFRNAMLINLHGEMAPLPPMRNYSDAAKDPLTHPWWTRAVTHPEQLRYASADTIKLRVYTYATDPSNIDPATQDLIDVVNLTISSSIPTSQIHVYRMAGGASTPYAWNLVTENPSDYSVNTQPTQTIIRLFNSPVLCPPNSGKGLGTDSSTTPPTVWGLYGQNYIPCVLNPSGSFVRGTRDLADANNGNYPVNTARWVIELDPNPTRNGQLTIETRMGNDPTTGTLSNQPTNLSRTYTWIGVAPPFTEQFQFIGDPRHMPYADVKANEGYNWYFRSIDPTKWPGFGCATDLWREDYDPGTLSNNHGENMDIPRFFQVIRTAITNSESLWNTITGFSFYYVGLGGEFAGMDMVERPWNPASNAVTGVNEINEDDGVFTQTNSRIISNASNNWFGLYWLGELYPDSKYTAYWVPNGNLPTGPGKYYRNMYTHPKFVDVGNTNTIPIPPHKRPAYHGSPSFYNGGSVPGTWFMHTFADFWYGIDPHWGTLSAAGLTLSNDLNFPLLNSVKAARPFRMDEQKNGKPPEWDTPPYNGASFRTVLTEPEFWYDADLSASSDPPPPGVFKSSALVRMNLNGRMGNMVVNGLSSQTVFGSAQIAKLCVLAMVRSFMTLGTASDGAIPPIPLVKITFPREAEDLPNPSSINVSWDLAWTRWDGQKYTENYPNNYVGSSTIDYNVKYSKDGGATWYFADDNSSAKAGVYNVLHQVTSTSTTWLTPAGTIPTGNYLLRVEAYRRDRELHYAYHQRQVYIKR